MKDFLAVVLFAVISVGVAWEVASSDGIAVIPPAWANLPSSSNGVVLVAKIDASAIDSGNLKSKVSEAIASAKARFAEIADRAIEAAQIDRSYAAAPSPYDTATYAATVRSVTAVDPAPMPLSADVTQFSGRDAGPAVAAWSAEAASNPEYDTQPKPAQVLAQIDAADEKLAPAKVPAATAPAAQTQDEPAVVVESAPVSLGGIGVTSYFGLAEKPDAEQPWAAAATVFADAEPQAAPAAESTPVADDAPVAAAEEPPPVSLGGVGQASYFGFADKPDSDHLWAAAATMNPDYTPDAAASETPSQPPVDGTPALEAATPAQDDAPVSLGGVGQTSFFGLANMPDANRPWAAEAAMNPDYSAEAPAADAATQEEPANAAEEQAPVSLGGIGQTSYFGIAEAPDANQPWAAPATVDPGYHIETPAATAAQAVTAPATPEAIENCRDALNAEAQAGGLNFALTSWSITPDNYAALDKLAKLAKDCGGVMIEVGGHTDNSGRPESNKTLSELRANAVVNYLVKEGVDPSKLKAVGYGEEKPAAGNATAEGRRRNRRIEFLVTPN